MQCEKRCEITSLGNRIPTTAGKKTEKFVSGCSDEFFSALNYGDSLISLEGLAHDSGYEQSYRQILWIC
jgi:hypothetical protein